MTGVSPALHRWRRSFGARNCCCSTSCPASQAVERQALLVPDLREAQACSVPACYQAAPTLAARVQWCHRRQRSQGGGGGEAHPAGVAQGARPLGAAPPLRGLVGRAVPAGHPPRPAPAACDRGTHTCVGSMLHRQHEDQSWCILAASNSCKAAGKKGTLLAALLALVGTALHAGAVALAVRGRSGRDVLGPGGSRPGRPRACRVCEPHRSPPCGLGLLLLARLDLHALRHNSAFVPLPCVAPPHQESPFQPCCLGSRASRCLLDD